ALTGSPVSAVTAWPSGASAAGRYVTTTCRWRWPMDAHTLADKWRAGMARLSARKPEDAEWRARVLRAVNRFVARFHVTLPGVTMSTDLVPSPEPAETPAL